MKKKKRLDQLKSQAQGKTQQPEGVEVSLGINGCDIGASPVMTGKGLITNKNNRGNRSPLQKAAMFIVKE